MYYWTTSNSIPNCDSDSNKLKKSIRSYCAQGIDQMADRRLVHGYDGAISAEYAYAAAIAGATVRNNENGIRSNVPKTPANTASKLWWGRLCPDRYEQGAVHRR